MQVLDSGDVNRLNHRFSFTNIQKNEQLLQDKQSKKNRKKFFRQKFAKSLAHVDFQTLADFTNLRHIKNGQSFAHDCINTGGILFSPEKAVEEVSHVLKTTF